MNLNLCGDAWLPFRLNSGETVPLPLRELGREGLLDIAMPRQDFHGAAWQFLIGVLQTVFAPRDVDEWLDRYESPPSADELAQALSKIEHAFDLFGDGPCFMQDFDMLEDGSRVGISSLLIDAPGANALRMNTDHFIKRGQINALGPAMAAMALFTLQINAPSGGQGHRTGLRGGGPLTTLVVSNDPSISLFRRLWLNVLPVDQYPELQPPSEYDEKIFPWLAPTRISKEKGSEVYYSDDDVHPLQQYWAMPRRIRLETDDHECRCDLTDEPAPLVVSAYRTKNYGINYEGTWSHPLTPYRYDPKKSEQAHNPAKGQPGGIGYRQWHQFLFENDAEGYLPAKVVAWLGTSQELLSDELHLDDCLSVWVFGFDMDNMKARSWHEARMPFLTMAPPLVPLFVQEVGDHVEVANAYRKSLRRNCKNAWLGSSDSSGDLSFVDDQFWAATEADFYGTVDKLKRDIEAGRQSLATEHCRAWVSGLRSQALALFDALVLSDASQSEHLERKLEARRWLEWTKPGKAYLKKHGLKEKGAVIV